MVGEELFPPSSWASYCRSVAPPLWLSRWVDVLLRPCPGGLKNTMSKLFWNWLPLQKRAPKKGWVTCSACWRRLAPHQCKLLLYYPARGRVNREMELSKHQSESTTEKHNMLIGDSFLPPKCAYCSCVKTWLHFQLQFLSDTLINKSPKMA